MGNEQYFVPMYTRFSTCHQSTAVCVLYTDAEERYVRFIFEVDVIVIVLVPEKRRQNGAGKTESHLVSGKMTKCKRTKATNVADRSATINISRYDRCSID